MSFNIFLKIITEGEYNQNDKFIKALNKEAGVPTKPVGGGPISTQFYESIDKQLKKGVSIEEIDVLNLIREVGDMNLSHKLSSIAFKRSRFKEWRGMNIILGMIWKLMIPGQIIIIGLSTTIIGGFPLICLC